jgi:hypothetical protein
VLPTGKFIASGDRIHINAGKKSHFQFGKIYKKCHTVGGLKYSITVKCFGNANGYDVRSEQKAYTFEVRRNTISKQVNSIPRKKNNNVIILTLIYAKPLRIAYKIKFTTHSGPFIISNYQALQ